MSEQYFFPSDWDTRKCSDVFEFRNGKAFYTEGYSNHGYRVIDLLNIDLTGKFQITAKDKFVTEAVYQKSARAHLFESDLIIIMTDITPSLGLIGKTAVVDKSNEYVLNQRVGCLRPKQQELSIAFMNYLFNSVIVRNQIVAATLGSVQFYVNTPVLKGLELPFPPLEQQQKIAKILSTVDNLIEKTQTLIDKYTAIKQGMMADLFTRGIDMTTGDTSNSKGGKLRPSVEDAPELYKQTELGWVPNEWEVKPLGDYLSMITYGFTNPMPETEDGPWMVTAANVVNGGIDYKKTRKTSLEAFNTQLTQKSKPKCGDILLTKDGTLGRLAIVDNEYLCINQSVALLRCNDDAKPEFLKLLLETERYYQKMLDDAGGSTIKHIYITIVDKMLLAMPSSEEEQIAIFTKANAINEKIRIEENNSEKYRKLKAGLMQDLLTGKVRVN